MRTLHTVTGAQQRSGLHMLEDQSPANVHSSGDWPPTLKLHGGMSAQGDPDTPEPINCHMDRQDIMGYINTCRFTQISKATKA